LYAYIKSLKIEPQLFLLRWIRLLFGREYPLGDTLTFWDAIFAFDKNFTLIDYIAVAMLIGIRDQLMNSDQNGVLQSLFKYQTYLSVSSILQHALDMAQAKTKRIVSQQPVLQQPATVNHMVRQATVGATPLGFLKVPGLSGGLGGNHVVQPQNDTELTQVKWLHKNVATRLDSIVSIFQADLLPMDKLVSERVLLAVAELKQIKDVMCGHLPLEALPTLQFEPSNHQFH